MMALKRAFETVGLKEGRSLGLGFYVFVALIYGCTIGPQGPPGPSGLSLLAGQQCPEGTYVIGFNPEGRMLCSGAQASPVRKGVNCTDPKNIRPQANLQLCQLGSKNLSGANLQHANLLLANLEHSNLTQVNFQGSQLSGANMRGASLQEANLQGIVGLKAKQSHDPGVSRALDLREANLEGADLTGAFLIGARLDNVLWKNTRCPDGRTSEEDDGDQFTCLNNLVAMELTIKDSPPIGKQGTITNFFGIPVDTSLVCIILNQDGTIVNTTTIETLTLQPQQTQPWTGTCPAVSPQQSHITVTATPRLS